MRIYYKMIGSFLMSEDKRDYINDFDSKKKKIERSQWRKLISIVLAGITLYLLFTYDIFDYTGYIIGFLLVIIWGILINYMVNKTFALFIE